MNTNRMSSFGIRSNTPLTNEQIFKYAPSVFATEAHESRSDRYAYIPTSVVLDGMRNEGFMPMFAAQSRSRIPGKSEFTKHLLRFRQVGTQLTVVGQEFFEIVLINSHDGTSSYQLSAGVFRLVCLNGMVCGESTQSIKVNHTGRITDQVIDAAFRIVDGMGAVAGQMEAFKSTPLLLPEKVAFAEAALTLRYDDELKESPITANALLQPRRREDMGGNDLWRTMNVVQENLTKGGVRGRNANGGRMSTREIQSIDGNVKLNKALWSLTEKMAELKGVAV